MAGSVLLIVTTFANAFWAGWLLALRPRQLTGTQDRYDGLHTTTAVFAVPFMLVAGLLADKWGVEIVLLLGGCLAALAFVGLDRGNSLVPTIGAAALLAGAIAALLVGSLVLMPHAFYPAHPARSMNLGFIAIALGGLGGGLFVSQLTTTWGHHKTTLALAMASLLPAACVVSTPAGDFGDATGGDITLLLSDVRIVLILVIAALCFPLDAALGPWVRRYVREHAYRPSSATLMAVGYWVAFLGTRLIVGLMLPTGWEHVWIVVWAILAVVILTNMLGAYSPGTNLAGLWLTGACCAPLVPTLLGLALRNYAESAGLVLGLTAAAGMLGNLLVLPWIDATRPECLTRTSLRGATALAVVLLVPALVLAVIGIL
ncbi:MAG TPA: hypothetical protein VE988_18505 [Gemmataceae bacterium]|nr:hypothetical protein [Gemmataceae bacterium]